MRNKSTAYTKNWFARHNVAIIFLWTTWISIEFVPIFQFSIIRVSDVIDAYLPVMIAKKFEFLKYGWTYWSNALLCGTDNWAWNEEPFHLFDFLPFVLPNQIWYFLLMFFQRWLAAYFTYRLCKDRLCFSNTTSFFCGAAYSLTFWPQREFYYFYGLGMPGLPFFIWIFGNCQNLKRFKNTSSFFLGLLFALTTYVPGGSIFFFPIIFVWGLLIEKRYSWDYFRSFFLFSLGSIVGDAPYLIAGSLLLPLSTRATLDLRLPGSIGNLKGTGVWLNYFILIKSFFKEYSVFCSLAAAGLFLVKLNNERKRLLILTGLTLFCTVIATLYLPLHATLSEWLRSLRGFGFYRFYLAGPFLMVIAGGQGLEVIFKSFSMGQLKTFTEKHRLNLQLILCLFLAFHILNQSVRIKLNAYRTYANYHLVAGRSDLRELRNETKGMLYRVVTAFTEDRWLPHYALFYGFDIADGYLSVYSKRYHDFWGKVIDPLLAKDPKKRNYFYNWRNKAYLFSPTNESLASDVVFSDQTEDVSSRFSEFYNLNLLSLANVRFIFSRRLITDERLKLISEEGDNKKWAKKSKFERLKAFFTGEYNGKKLYIYENQNYFQRIFLIDKLKSFKTETDLLDALAKIDIQELRRVGLIDENSMDKNLLGMFKNRIQPIASNEIIQINQYSPDFIDLHVTVKTDRILIHSMSYAPYWRAIIDGKPEKVFPVYHVFQGVLISAGSHNVILEYCPPYRVCRDSNLSLSKH